MTTRKTRESTASRSADTTTGKDSGIDFEKALSDLESIVERLEQGDLPLEESLKAFERGVELTRHCQTALKQAEQKVEILLRKTGQAEEFEPGTTRDAPADD